MKEPSGNGWKKMCFCLLFFFLAYMAGQGVAAEKNAVKTISKGHIKMAAEEENETAEEEKKEIALTFDDGPNPEYTPMLLKGLRKRNVKATFFLLGEEVEQYPDIVKEMVEEGHLLGVHSYQHVNFKEAGVEEALKQIEKTQEAIRNVTGSNCGYIRPPYGCWQKVKANLDCKDKFVSVKVAEPLLGEVGSDAASVNADKESVAKAVTAKAVEEAGYDSLKAAKKEKTAFVFMGHGTSHTAKVSYSQMQEQMKELGYDNVFIGTVEGEPEDTACAAIIDKVAQAGYKKVILRPLMVVAGDHANNDMAGDEEDSWKSQFYASGKFDSIETQISGLGSIEDIRKIYVAHTKAVM